METAEQQTSEFSARYHLVLSMIDNGKEWVNWVGSAGMQLAGLSESERLETIQVGLHGSPLILIPQAKLLAHPVKLMQLSDTDLSTLNAGGNAVTEEFLTQNKLVNESAFQKTSPLFAQYDLSEQLDQLPQTLADRIALAELVEDKSFSANPRQGAALHWAIEKAQNGSELRDYALFFTAVTAAEKNGKGWVSLVNQAFKNLTEMSFRLIQCPQIDRRETVDDMLAELRNKLKSGWHLGFMTSASALRHVTSYAGAASKSGAELMDAINSFLLKAAAIVEHNQPSSVGSNQDGSLMLLEFIDKTGQLVLAVDAEGCITINSFIPAGGST